MTEICLLRFCPGRGNGAAVIMRRVRETFVMSFRPGPGWPSSGVGKRFTAGGVFFSGVGAVVVGTLFGGQVRGGHLLGIGVRDSE